MAKTKKDRVHREHFRPVLLSGRKSCPACKAKTTQFFSWGEYVRAKWRTVKHFCQLCYPNDVEKELVRHALACGCTFELVPHGFPMVRMPGWVQLPPMSLTGMPTVEQVVKLCGPTEEWKGRCHEVACRAAACYINDLGLPRYGAWLGGVHPDSFFAGRRGVPFIRHGWFELHDGRVFDPTRWVFEAAHPYIYVGPADVYDVGMAKAKEMLGAYRPAPKFDPSKEVIKLSGITNDHFRAVAETFFGGDPVDEVNIDHVFFLGNMPPHMMGGRDRVKGVYEVLVAAGHRMVIPMDFQEMYLKPKTAKQAVVEAGFTETGE